LGAQLRTAGTEEKGGYLAEPVSGDGPMGTWTPGQRQRSPSRHHERERVRTWAKVEERALLFWILDPGRE